MVVRIAVVAILFFLVVLLVDDFVALLSCFFLLFGIDLLPAIFGGIAVVVVFIILLFL